jgi:hypothetical protein
MSTELYRNSEYVLTSFYGGTTRGKCIQITLLDKQYLTLSKEELIQFINKLKEALNE